MSLEQVTERLSQASSPAVRGKLQALLQAAIQVHRLLIWQFGVLEKYCYGALRFKGCRLQVFNQ